MVCIKLSLKISFSIKQIVNTKLKNKQKKTRMVPAPYVLSQNASSSMTTKPSSSFLIKSNPLSRSRVVHYFAVFFFHKTSSWKDWRICSIQTDQLLPDLVCCLLAGRSEFLCIEVSGMSYRLSS